MQGLKSSAAAYAAQDRDFDLLILDLGLPGMDGHDVLTEIRRRGERMPVIILTARDEERLDRAAKAIGQGASSPVSHPQPSWPSHPSGRYHATRPAAIFNATGPSSLFGAEPDPIDEQSLDDVILSYISEDLDTTGSE